MTAAGHGPGTASSRRSSRDGALEHGRRHDHLAGGAGRLLLALTRRGLRPDALESAAALVLELDEHVLDREAPASS
jgi:hypothetical protein